MVTWPRPAAGRPPIATGEPAGAVPGVPCERAPPRPGLASGSPRPMAALVGFGIAVQREHVWYLAALHVRPAFQSRGIGAEIIRRQLAAATPGEPTDGRGGRPKSRLERALRPVRDVPRDAAGRGVGRPVAERSPGSSDPGRRHRTSWPPSTAPSSASARPEDHAFWGSVPGLHAFSVMRGDRAGRLRLRPGRRRDRPDRRPRPGGPRGRRRGRHRRRRRARRDERPDTHPRGRARGDRADARSRLALRRRGHARPDLGALGPLGSLRHVRRGRSPVIDLVLRNARALRRDRRPAIDGDLAIHDGRIVSVGEPVADGAAARGHRPPGFAVAPGFIDLHTHSDVSLLSDPGCLSAIEQGITTQVRRAVRVLRRPRLAREPRGHDRGGAGLRLPGRRLGLDVDRRLSRGRRSGTAGDQRDDDGRPQHAAAVRHRWRATGRRPRPSSSGCARSSARRSTRAPAGSRPGCPTRPACSPRSRSWQPWRGSPLNGA